MKIAIACDHGALLLKEALIPYIKSLGHSVEDFGTHSLESCDYPDYAIAAAKAVAKGKCDRGIVLCTTGIGVSIAANKVHGIRCALLHDEESARMTRMHNDTNMMALGAATVGQELAFDIVKIWLSTPFSREMRHQRRINKIMDLEREEKKKTTRKLRRRRPVRLGGLAGNLVSGSITTFLSVILVISMLLTPIAAYITNMANPETLVNVLFESGLLNSSSPEEEAPPEDLAPDDSETPDSSENPGDSSENPADSSEDPADSSENPADSSEDPAVPEDQTDENEPAVIDEPDAGEPENPDSSENPDADEPENPDSSENPADSSENPDDSSEDPDAGESENPDAPEDPDHAGETNNAVNSLLDIMGGFTGSGIIDVEHLNEFLDLPEDTVVDVEKLTSNLATSEAAKALVSAYMEDVMNTAMGSEAAPTLTSDTVMSIVNPHIGELADIVQASLPEDVTLDRAHLEDITQQALESVLPGLVADLPDLGSAAAELLESENPIISAVTGALRFIHSGALRAAVLLLVVAMAALICLVRLPGLRGLRCVGVCGIVGGALCYAATMTLGMLPELVAVLPENLAVFGNMFLQTIVPITSGLNEAFTVCAIVYAVVGLALVIGTTLLRGFFSALFGRLFADAD